MSEIQLDQFGKTPAGVTSASLQVDKADIPR